MFHINTSKTEKGLQVDVMGRVDTLNAYSFGQQLAKLISEGNTHLVLRFSGLEYMSSAGLRELVRVFKLAKVQGGDLRVLQPSASLLSVLQITGLDSIVL